MKKDIWTIIVLISLTILMVLFIDIFFETFYTDNQIKDCCKLCSGMSCMANDTGCYCQFHEWVLAKTTTGTTVK